MIDLAFLTGSWKYERDDAGILTSEKYKANRFMLSVSYRL
jgi:hypothetical protein